MDLCKKSCTDVVGGPQQPTQGKITLHDQGGCCRGVQAQGHFFSFLVHVFLLSKKHVILLNKKHVLLLNKKTCLRVEQEHMSPC